MHMREIAELETVCGFRMGAIYTRIAAIAFKFAYIRETIRLGLIGGGLVPAEAVFLVQRYIDDRPVNENNQPAADIMRTLFEGASGPIAGQLGTV